ncbi:MAG: hypothetical protein AAGC66_00275 [Leifsonia sp.]
MTEENMNAPASLAAAVSAVPGVTRVYPAGTLIDRMAAREDVAIGDDRIRIRIGVAAEVSAAEVCRRVYTVAREWAAGQQMLSTRIEVTAASIDHDTPQ